MFRAVVIFNRPDTSANFFYTEYIDHPVVKEIQAKFESSQGFIGKRILLKTDTTFEVAMEFSSFENFMTFVEKNKELIEQRNELVKFWCETNRHQFDHRFENI
jgi:hypothetical protein